MRFVKRISVLLLLAFLMISGVFAEDISGTLPNGINWTLYDTGELVIDGDGEIPDVRFTSASYWKEYISDITEVTIGDGITSIGNYAFSEFKNLESVHIPYGVKRIGYSAFNGCASLKSVNIPKSVESIGSSAF